MVEKKQDAEREGSEVEPPKSGKKKRGWLRLIFRGCFVFLLLFGLFLVWFNGPGMRLLIPKVAKGFLEKDGEFQVDFALGGTLLGGVDVYDLELSSDGAIERLVIERLETDYRVGELVKGDVRGVVGRGIHLDFRVLEKEEEEEDKPPLDFKALGKMLNEVREKVLPLDLDVSELSVSVKKEGELVVSLDESSLRHVVGEDLIVLNVGKVTEGGGKFVAGQAVEILWERDGLRLDKLDVLPILGVRDVRVGLPEDGLFTLVADIGVAGASFRVDVGEGGEDVSFDLAEGELDFGRVLGGLRAFGLGLPVKGVLKGFSVDLEGVYPEWQGAVGVVKVGLEGFEYEDWAVPELSLGVELGDAEVSVELAGVAYDSEFSIDGVSEFGREKILAEGFVLDGFAGDVRIDNLYGVLAGLDRQLELGLSLSSFPKSAIVGSWDVVLGEEGFGGAGLDVKLEASEVEAGMLRLAGRYEGDFVTVSAVEVEGLRMSGSYDLGGGVYEGAVEMEGFDSRVMEPWVRGLGVEVPGYGVFDMVWKGGGNLEEKKHEGVLSDFGGVWEWARVAGEAGRPSIRAGASVEYDWPKNVKVDGLELMTLGQKVELDAILENNELDLSRLIWTDGGVKMAGGAGRFPVPEDFSDFKGFIANDSRLIDFEFVTEMLPISKLKPWVGQVAQLDEAAKGKVEFRVGGSLAGLEVDTVLELRDISVPEQPNVPRTDVVVNVSAREGVAKISARIDASDYEPAVLSAEVPFLPKKWADDPGLITSEKVQGVMDLPRIDVSRFQALVPGVEELAGVLTGRMTVGGTVGEPKVNGEMDFSGGKFKMEGATVPPLEGITLRVDTDLDKVMLKGGVEDMAGGNVTFLGEVTLKAEEGGDDDDGGGLGRVDFSLKGRGLPLVRNEFLITRANVDLSVKGPMNGATISGEVGILDSVFYKDVELIPIGKPFLEPSAAALPSVDTPNPGEMVPAPFDEWSADIVIKTIDPILVRGNLGTGEVDVALRVEGKLGDPKPNGTVRLSKVVARLPFTTLRIDEGLVKFTPETGFDPTLEIRGVSEPRPFRVQMFVYGNASNPQLVLTSEPPLPENEIMTLLATGATTSGLEDSQAASSRATQLLVEELRRGRFIFGKQLRPVLGLLDNVDFNVAESNPYDSGSFTSATLKLSEKWFVSAGLGEEGDQRALGIWRLKFR